MRRRPACCRRARRRRSADRRRRRRSSTALCLVVSLVALVAGARRICSAASAPVTHDAAARPAVDRRAFPHRCALGVLPRRGQSRRRRGEPVRARLRPARGGAAARAAVLSGVPRRHEPRRARRRRLHASWSSWEFMSLASWALVMAHHRDARQCARRLRLSGHGELRHARAAARLRPAGRARRRLRLRRDARQRIRPPALAALVL